MKSKFQKTLTKQLLKTSKDRLQVTLFLKNLKQTVNLLIPNSDLNEKVKKNTVTK